MPRKSPKATEFEELRDAGIGLPAKLVLENKLDQAKDVFTKLLNLRPDDVIVMTLRTNIYSFEGKLLEVENRLNQVLTLNPDYPLALYFLGVVYHEKGEQERAIQMYETALKHFSDDKKEDIADVYQNLGCSLWEVGKREGAMEALQTCLKYNPEQKYAQENIKNFTNEYGMDTSFIAPCGMNCGICMAYLRDKNKCPGCRGDDFNKPVTRAKCKIKNCVFFQTGAARYCFECEQFPCNNLKHLDKRSNQIQYEHGRES